MVAATINIPVYSDALVVLGTAGIIVPMVHRWGLSPVLGYLGAGAILGPLGLGSFIQQVPLLYWLTVVDAKNVAGIADLGVVFLLFLIGLELSYERLMAMRRFVFGLGLLQVAITSTVLASILALAGLKGPVAIILGACLALSSTAIVLEVLSREGRLATSAGRATFAILLCQDIAVIPILMLVSVIGADHESSLANTVVIAALQAVAAVAVIAVVGRMLLRPLFRQVARTQSSELFIAAVLFVIIATGVVAALANLSMALGAFVAGLLLAETEYRKAIEVTIEPFKGLLLGIFFFTVGMSIDVRVLARDPVLLLASVAGLIALKAAICLGVGRLFRLSWWAAIESGLLLGAGGEFAFVGIGLAASLSIVSPETTTFALAVTSLSMALIPLMSVLAHRINPANASPRVRDPALALVPQHQERHAIVVGYGRVGKVVCKLLKHHGIGFTAVDQDPNTVSGERAKGNVVYYGDATSPGFLKACGVTEASAVIVTIHTLAMIDEIVREVRALRPDIPVVSRARDAEHARHLYAIGVSDAVPETIEASLQLSEAALVGLGIPTGLVIASIHEMRDEFRHELQQAAQAAGIAETRSVRPKELRDAR
jgi:CPA2 family monovalent cation:H+ antiporter-2